MPESPNSSLPVWPVLCPDHRDAPAVALCTRCGRFLCEDCRSLDASDLAVCPECQDVPEVNEAFWVNRPLGGAVHNAFQTVKAALFTPSQYARRVRLQGEVNTAVKFGVAMILLGKLAFLLWILLLQREAYWEAVQPISQEFGLSVESYLFLQVLLLPLDALARLALFALMLQLGIRLAVGPSDLRYRHAIRLVAYAVPGYLFLMVPLIVGMAMAFYVVLLLTARCLRMQLQLTGRQTAIAMIPMALFLLFFDFFGGL